MNMSLGFAVLVFVVYVVAVARVTRLINHDTIFDPVRLAIASRVREHQTLADGYDSRGALGAAILRRRARRWSTLLEFVGCPWCVGMWLSLATAVLPVLYVGLPWWCFLPVALATSHLVGVAASLSSSEEIEIVEVD